MKGFITILLFLVSLATQGQLTLQASAPAAEGTVALKEPQFNFGRIPQGRPVTHVFEIVNTGKDSLKISNVQATCGCTTPEWTKDVVAPGKSTFITVGYNAAAEGPFEKSINVHYNEGLVKQILIRGQVYKTPSGPAPLNASIQLLKNINQ